MDNKMDYHLKDFIRAFECVIPQFLSIKNNKKLKENPEQKIFYILEAG